MIYSFLYVFTIAISNVLIQKLDISISPLFSLLITSIITMLYFNLINVHKLKSMYLACWHNKRLWITIMSLILVLWVCTMVAPGLIGASSFNFLYFASVGTLGFLSLGRQNWQANYLKFYCGLFILALIIVNIGFELSFSFTRDTTFGIILSLIGGICTFAYFKQSQAVIKNMHLSATQILAVRFYLTILVTFFILPPHSVAQYFTLNNLISLIVLACISMIIPLYFSQKALENISSENHSIITSLCPVITSILQEVIFHDVKLELGIVYSLYCITLTGFYLIGRYVKKAEVNA